MLRRITGRFAAPPPEPPPDALHQAELLLKVKLLPYWLFWQNLRAMRPWWPVLLPALLIYGMRMYRRERRTATAPPAGTAGQV